MESNHKTSFECLCSVWVIYEFKDNHICSTVCRTILLLFPISPHSLILLQSTITSPLQQRLSFCSVIYEEWPLLSAPTLWLGEMWAGLILYERSECDWCKLNSILSSQGLCTASGSAGFLTIQHSSELSCSFPWV